MCDKEEVDDDKDCFFLRYGNELYRGSSLTFNFTLNIVRLAMADQLIRPLDVKYFFLTLFSLFSMSTGFDLIFIRIRTRDGVKDANDYSCDNFFFSYVFICFF